jgi:uncharacterized membrane protein
MIAQRWRPVVFALIALLAIWAIAIAGFTIARNSKVTAEKVRAYVESTDLSKLKGEARAKALRKLADMLNRLSIEERQQARMERLATAWFNEMTEDERAQFIEATMPTGFKQMLTAFEQLPEDKRRRTVEDAFRRLKEQESKARSGDFGGSPETLTNQPPVLSKELEAKIRTIGLQTFYSQSSAQTKAELAPVLEELQKVMESGRPFRGGRP